MSAAVMETFMARPASTVQSAICPGTGPGALDRGLFALNDRYEIAHTVCDVQYFERQIEEVWIQGSFIRDCLKTSHDFIETQLDFLDIGHTPSSVIRQSTVKAATPRNHYKPSVRPASCGVLRREPGYLFHGVRRQRVRIRASLSNLRSQLSACHLCSTRTR
jgi:hypothetical protein